MKNSKLEKFKNNELDSLDKVNKFKGGADSDATVISCYEPTDEPGGDTAVERWPDEGGVVTRFVFRTLAPH